MGYMGMFLLGFVVGATAPAMDRELGYIYKRKTRGGMGLL